MPAPTTLSDQLRRDIGDTMDKLKMARFLRDEHEQTVCARRIDWLLARVAARPLRLIDPALDQWLTVH